SRRGRGRIDSDLRLHLPHRTVRSREGHGAALGGGQHHHAGHRPCARCPAQDQVGDGRRAVLPPVVCPWCVGFGRRARPPAHARTCESAGSLSFRRSCAHGVCGSDATRINGRNRLACKTLLKDLDTSKTITVEAIKGLPLEKDMIVDMEPFFQSYREIMPFLVTSGHEPTRERLQSAEQRQAFDDTTKCILCAACTSSCPVFWTDGHYFGPAAIVNAHRFIFDSRDEGGDMRLEILNDKE